MNNNARFDGVKRIYSDNSFEKLANFHIAVFGIGGVGSWSAESLARSGVGKITLVDLDDICISNTNRQIHALEGNYGKLKVQVMKERIMQINPECEVNCIEDFFSETTKDEILSNDFDYVIDAIDSIKSKCILINACKRRKINIITTGGAGGKFDPRYIMIKDLGRSYNDSLTQLVRNNLRRFYGLRKNKNGKYNIPCIFSPEFRTEPENSCDVKNLNCQNGYGSLSHITGIFGFMAAGYAVNHLLEKTAKVELKDK